MRTQCPENTEIIGKVQQPENGEHGKPEEHHRAKYPAYGGCTELLEKKEKTKDNKNDDNNCIGCHMAQGRNDG